MGQGARHPSRAADAWRTRGHPCQTAPAAPLIGSHERRSEKTGWPDRAVTHTNRSRAGRGRRLQSIRQPRRWTCTPCSAQSRDCLPTPRANRVRTMHAQAGGRCDGRTVAFSRPVGRLGVVVRCRLVALRPRRSEERLGLRRVGAEPVVLQRQVQGRPSLAGRVPQEVAAPTSGEQRGGRAAGGGGHEEQLWLSGAHREAIDAAHHARRGPAQEARGVHRDGCVVRQQPRPARPNRAVVAAVCAPSDRSNGLRQTTAWRQAVAALTPPRCGRSA